MSINIDNTGAYLSVVLTAGSDQPCGQMRLYLQASVDSWVEQARQLGISSEVIVVAWGNPGGRRREAEQLRVVANTDCNVRILEIPPELPANGIIARNAVV